MTSSHAQSDESPDDASPETPTGPRIDILGDASPEQVAALVAVLSGVGGDGDEEAPGPASRWASRERLVQAPRHPAPGAWRAAAFPG